MNGGVKHKIISGVLWQGLGRYSALLVQFIVTVFIARVLEPRDYGIIGLLTVFVSVSLIILESGFGQALIQKGKCNNTDFSSVFYFNFTFSIFIYILLYVLSPFIASFYDLPELTYYARILFLIIPINSICIVQNTQLNMDMSFKKISIIQLISAIISGLLGVYMAYSGYGMMSLIAHSLSLNVSKAVLLTIFNRWYPRWEFSLNSIKQLLPLGMSLLLTRLTNVVFQNIYTLVIGKKYSAIEVGYYNQAKRFEELSGNTLVDIIINVSFPALVKMKDNINEVKKIYSNIFKITTCILSPLLFCLIFSSREIFVMVLTEKWLPAVPYFDLLCIYGLTLPLHLINNNVFKVFAKGKLIVYLELFRRFVLIIAILFTLNIGISAMLIGQIIAMIPVIVVSLISSGKLINYSFKEQVLDVIPYYIISVILYSIVNNIVFDINNLSFIILIKCLLIIVPYVILVALYPNTILNMKFKSLIKSL